MQNSKFSDIKDEIGEMAIETVKVVKKQITQKPADQTQDQAGLVDSTQGKQDKRTDPVTGKPIPSKKLLTHLTQQTAQLAQMRLKKVREELEKQRLKVSEPASAKATAGQAGPEIKQEDKKPKDDAVAKTLAASKSTGEFKGLIGG